MKRCLLFSALLASSLLCAAQSKTTNIDKNLTIYTDVMRQLDMNYVDTLNYENLTETAINRMLQRIDPYTVYIPEREDESLRMMTTGKYGGIGAIIMQRDTGVYISEPYQGMPAEQAGLQAGDRFITVDGMDCTGKNTKQVSDKLRGKAGTTLTITVERNGEQLTREVMRRDIHMPAVSYAAVMQDSVAYIAFSEFTTNSAQEFLTALDSMVQHYNVRRLVLDLRGNVGGIIDEAIQIVSYFIPRGTEVVSTRGKALQNCRSYTTQTSPIYPDMPIAVLVDEQSASSAEIVAGSLQDLHRATLLGQRTFGKGLVQNVRPIAYGGHLKVTTAKYYLPSGRCIQAIDYAERQRGNELRRDTAGGILPDIVLTDSQKVDICYALYRNNMFFDYATRYRQQHATIPQPQDFTITDADIEDFCRFLDERQFTYETETGRYFAELLKVAESEDLDSTLLAELKAWKPRLTLDYRAAILRNRQEFEMLLGAEIVKRYYYQKGNYAYTLRFDPELERAMEVIKN